MSMIKKYTRLFTQGRMKRFRFGGMTLQGHLFMKLNGYFLKKALFVKLLNLVARAPRAPKVA